MPQFSQNPFSNITPVVKNLLIINIIFFIASYALLKVGVNMVWLAAFYPKSHFFRPWQIVTYMFMHAGFGHIFSNMLGLFFAGPILEQTFGSKRFFNYYFITGIGALFFNYLVQAFQVYHITGSFFPNLDAYVPHSQTDYLTLLQIYQSPTLGASGAIFGLLAGIFVLYPDLEFIIFPIPVPVRVKYAVPVYFFYEIYAGIHTAGGDMIAHYAHVGGAIVGYLLIKLWHTRTPNNFY